MKKALITGVNGQDGSYLAELLLSKNYKVMGTVRKGSCGVANLKNIEHIKNDIKIVSVDLLDIESLMTHIAYFKPHEIYNLAAQSHVNVSFTLPEYTLGVNGTAVMKLLERMKKYDPSCKIYQASTSEMFGNSLDSDGFQRETTKMTPVSPYGAAKLYAHNMCNYYRDAYGMFICSGILFNHESPRRGIEFVTKKIVEKARQIKLYGGFINMGNLDSTRDWGHSKDYVMAMWMMLQHTVPMDFVCATGVSTSVRQFANMVFNKFGLNFDDHYVFNPEFERKKELHHLKGNSSKIESLLGWHPKYDLEKIIDDMINNEG